MVLKEDIIPLKGGYDSVDIKPVVAKLQVGIRKLLNKSPESVQKGVEIVKNITREYPELKNSSLVNNTLMNYIRENPVKSAGIVSAVSLLTSLGVVAYQGVKKLIERYNYADDKAYRAMKTASKFNADINPTLYYLQALSHYFVKGEARRNVFRTNLGYDLKRAHKLVNHHDNPPPIVENQINRGFNWRYLPLTALATGILGYGAMKLGQFSQNRRIANNNYWNTYLTANNRFLSNQERINAINSIDS